jgi:hypothetical protein
LEFSGVCLTAFLALFRTKEGEKGNEKEEKCNSTEIEVEFCHKKTTEMLCKRNSAIPPYLVSVNIPHQGFL